MGSHDGQAMVQFHTLTVADIRHETSQAVCVSLEVPKDKAGIFAFQPGQYLTFEHQIGGELVRRPYSICSVPGAAHLQVGIKAVDGGCFSTFANASLKVGDTLAVMPPAGQFCVDLDATNQKHYLLLAAGSGITPILSIAASVLDREPHSRISLLYGNRNTASVMFHEALDDLKNRYLDRFSLTWLMSREPQDVELHTGRLDGAKLREMFTSGLLQADRIDEVFLCGPGEFIDNLETALLGRGIAPDRTHHERFSSTDGAAATTNQHLTAVPQTGCEITVHLNGASRSFLCHADDANLIEAARRAGIELPWSCRGGMCCTCRCKQLAGESEMLANFLLEPWELEAGYVLACQLRPQSKYLELDFDAS